VIRLVIFLTTYLNKQTMSGISSKASLRIFTDEADASFISTTLQVQPTTQHSKGERRSKRNPNSSVFDQSVWIYDSQLPDTCELHEHLNNLLHVLEAKQARLASIRNQIASIDIFCMYSSENGQGSAEVDSILLRRLADQKLDLIIDLYPPN